MLLWNIGRSTIIKGEYTLGLDYIDEAINLMYKEGAHPEFKETKLDFNNLKAEILVNV